MRIRTKSDLCLQSQDNTVSIFEKSHGGACKHGDLSGRAAQLYNQLLSSVDLRCRWHARRCCLWTVYSLLAHNKNEEAGFAANKNGPRLGRWSSAPDSTVPHKYWTNVSAADPDEGKSSRNVGPGLVRYAL